MSEEITIDLFDEVKRGLLKYLTEIEEAMEHYNAKASEWKFLERVHLMECRVRASEKMDEINKSAEEGKKKVFERYVVEGRRYVEWIEEARKKLEEMMKSAMKDAESIIMSILVVEGVEPSYRYYKSLLETTFP